MNTGVQSFDLFLDSPREVSFHIHYQISNASVRFGIGRSPLVPGLLPPRGFQLIYERHPLLVNWTQSGPSPTKPLVALGQDLKILEISGRNRHQFRTPRLTAAQHHRSMKFAGCGGVAGITEIAMPSNRQIERLALGGYGRIPTVWIAAQNR
jgi:hypothetical protein